MSCSKSTNLGHSITDIEIEEFIYVWEIKNFRFYNFQKPLISPLFLIGKNKELKWNITIYNKSDNNEYLSLCLGMADAKSENDATLVLSISGKNGVETIIKEKFFHIKYKQSEVRTFSEFIRKDYLFDEKNELLVNGNFTIICKMYVQGDVINNVESEQPKPYIDSAIAYDLEALFKSKELSDVKLTIGQEEFQAHKCILAARSKVFSAMFQHDMMEKNESTVKIEDIDPKVMKEVLRFMYCGKIKSKESISDLLVAANKYELEELKDICQDQLLDSLNGENIGLLFILADQHKAEKLKKHVLKFITSHAKDINFEKFKTDVESYLPVLVDLVRELIS